ncbi:MAG: hypothetical protein FWE74_10890 [Oscillospiraceae bacterium]|nr:hypothetical protein [Oscillospiraceae bacterium]
MTSFGKNLDTLYRRLGNGGLIFLLFAVPLFVHVMLSLRMSLPSLPEEFAPASLPVEIMYSPFYFLIDNPVVRYRSMLIMNGVFAALIPLLTYKITLSLGVEKAWQRTLCAVIAGAGTAVLTYTKFITTETLSVFFPFLFFWLFIRTSDVKNLFLRFLLSLIAGALSALAPVADSRLWVLVAAFILTVLYSRFILRVKTISFIAFFSSFAVLTAFHVYTNGFILWGVGDAAPYVERLYHFAVSTWGIGVLGIILCVSAFRRADSPPALKAFAFFALVYNAAAIGQGLSHIDSASPLLVLFAFCYVFIHGLEFNRLLITAITLGIIFAVNYSRALISEVSAVFCLIALLFVLVSCAVRYRSHIITFCMSIAMLYFSINSAFVFLPEEARRAEARNAETVIISEFVFNSADAPPTYIINNANLAPLLRFLNNNTVIKTAGSFDELPEDCFVIFRNETGELIFEPRGERAIAFAISQEE